MMAGNDVPDIIHLYFGITGAFVPPGTGRVRESKVPGSDASFLPATRSKTIPTWRRFRRTPGRTQPARSTGRCTAGRSIAISAALNYFFKNTDMWNQKIGADTAPKDAADLKKIITELNDPSNDVWGFGAQITGRSGILGFAQMFGAPNAWGLDASGKVVRDRETEQFKAAIAYCRDLWTSGLMLARCAQQYRRAGEFRRQEVRRLCRGFRQFVERFLAARTEPEPAHELRHHSALQC